MILVSKIIDETAELGVGERTLWAFRKIHAVNYIRSVVGVIDDHVFTYKELLYCLVVFLVDVLVQKVLPQVVSTHDFAAGVDQHL